MQVHEERAGGSRRVAGVAGRARRRADRAAGKFVDAEAAARWSILLAIAGDQSPARCALARSLIAQRRLLEARATLAPVDGSEADALREQHPRDRRRAADRAGDGRGVPRDPAHLPGERGPVDRAVARRRCGCIDIAGGHRGRVCDSRSRSPACDRACRRVRADRRRSSRSPRACSIPASPCRSSARGQSDEAGVADPLRRHGRRRAVVPLVDGRAADPAGCRQHPRSRGHRRGAGGARSRASGCRSPQTSRPLIPDLVGDSSAMETVRQAVMKAAASPFPVLIEGESGVGQGAGGARGSRRQHPPRPPVLRAQLRGDRRRTGRGGAVRPHARRVHRRRGRARSACSKNAQGGTLFLDEVAELSARVQAKLLRTLQEGEVRQARRIGARARSMRGSSPPPIVRSNGEVSAGRFRNDLRYRLDVLAHHAFRRCANGSRTSRRWCATSGRCWRSAPAAAPCCRRRRCRCSASYDWPGNVRELQNVLASVMVAGPQRGVIGPHGLPGHITRATAMTSAGHAGRRAPRIRRALRAGGAGAIAAAGRSPPRASSACRGRACAS